MGNRQSAFAIKKNVTCPEVGMRISTLTFSYTNATNVLHVKPTLVVTVFFEKTVRLMLRELTCQNTFFFN